MEIDIHSYDKYIFAFSGGKDSIACVLHMIESGVPREKMELWHHDVDGHGPVFMDWEITHDYCQKFADAMGIPIYYSYKEGGFKGEMLRENSKTKPNHFQDENHQWQIVGGTTGKDSTRRKFPQVSVDLSVRWCSPYVKIDVCTASLNNQDRFRGIRTLVISGERGEESAARGKYAILEPDKADLRDGKKYQRHIDRYRPIRDFSEQWVWGIIERHKIRVHPCYYLGFSRCSCKFCIFGNADQFATAYYISPDQGQEIIKYEQEFGVTIKRDISLINLMWEGKIYDSLTEELMALATSYTYTEKIIMDEPWLLPSGAYADSCGPT